MGRLYKIGLTMPPHGTHWENIKEHRCHVENISNKEPQMQQHPIFLPSPGALDDCCCLVLFAKQLFPPSFSLNYLQSELYGEKVNIHTLPREGTRCWISLLRYLKVLGQGRCLQPPSSWPQLLCALWQIWIEPSCELGLCHFVSWCTMVGRILPSMDRLPPGTARAARTSRGAPSSFELLSAPFLGGTFGLGFCVMPPAGLPVAIVRWKACSCPPGVLSFLIRPSHPDTGGLLHEAFPLCTLLIASCLTSGLLNRANSWMPASITAFIGSEVDTSRLAFRMFSGCFLGKQRKNIVQNLQSRIIFLICSHKIFRLSLYHHHNSGSYRIGKKRFNFYFQQYGRLDNLKPFSP